MNTKLNLMAKDGGPFNCMPAREGMLESLN